MKILLNGELYSGVEKFVIQLKKLWEILKPFRRVVIIDGEEDLRNFILKFFGDSPKEGLKNYLQIRDSFLRDVLKPLEKNLLKQIATHPIEEDELLIVINVPDKDTIERLKMEGFKIYSYLEPTQEERYDHLREIFQISSDKGDDLTEYLPHDFPTLKEEDGFKLNDLGLLSLSQVILGRSEGDSLRKL
jgi:hypothetical protein